MMSNPKYEKIPNYRKREVCYDCKYSNMSSKFTDGEEMELVCFRYDVVVSFKRDNRIG